MTVQKPLRLDADAFCVSYASLPELNRMGGWQRRYLHYRNETAVIEVAEVQVARKPDTYLVSRKTGVLFDMNDNCMSSAQIRLGGVTTEKPRPLAYQGFPAFTVSENAPTEKPKRKKKEAAVA